MKMIILPVTEKMRNECSGCWARLMARKVLTIEIAWAMTWESLAALKHIEAQWRIYVALFSSFRSLLRNKNTMLAF